MKCGLLLATSLLMLAFLEDVSAKDEHGGVGRGDGRLMERVGRGGARSFGSSGSSSKDGIFVNNPILDFLIFLAIVGGVLILIGTIMAVYKMVKGSDDPSTRGLLESDEENEYEYDMTGNKSRYGIANPEEIFTDTKNFVARVGENRNYQQMPETTDNRMDFDSQSHRLFDQFDSRPRVARGGWSSNYQHIPEEPSNYHNSGRGGGWQ